MSGLDIEALKRKRLFGSHLEPAEWDAIIAELERAKRLTAEVWRFWENQPHTDVMWSELDNPYREEYPLIAAILRENGDRG